ncbi:hypothetical protein F8388_020635 [Cannabis sativa]|uniref:Uncharacterized protein n=1 Tax=Cannabis sativa TaxID=3483 RepID=A0A7J6F2L2_CANSA|nr:hypothetical protein F8388_020635 [Cannabis sativa]
MFGGRNMGGGGTGGRLVRSFGRAVTRSNIAGGPIPEPISSSSSSSTTTATTSTTTNPKHAQKKLSLSSPSPASSSSSSSSPFASLNVPVSSVHGLPTSSSWPHSDELDWVSVDEGYPDEDTSYGFVDDYFGLGPVPSDFEVHNAISALQQLSFLGANWFVVENDDVVVGHAMVFNADSYSNLIRDRFSLELDRDHEDHLVMSPTGLAQRVVSPVVSDESDSDWMEPSICMCNSKLLQYHGSDRVYDAFNLLRTEPLVQKMVKSLSSDEAVWNAVMNNEVVRELKESFSAAEDGGEKNWDERPKEECNEATNIVKLIFDSTRGKIMQVIEKITKIMNDLFQEKEKTTASEMADLFKEKLRTSFMLSIMVLLVVVITRSHKA